MVISARNVYIKNYYLYNQFLFTPSGLIVLLLLFTSQSSLILFDLTHKSGHVNVCT